MQLGSVPSAGERFNSSEILVARRAHLRAVSNILPQPWRERMEEKPSKFISKLISTERRLRLAMGSFALSLPVILVAWSLYTDYGILPSMSHYYFASAMSFPMRTWFVGILFTLGFFLIFYRGFSPMESILLSTLGFCAMAVAVVHMDPDPKYCKQPVLIDGIVVIKEQDVCGGSALPWWLSWWPSWGEGPHATFAIIVFVCMALVVLLCSQQTFAELSAKQLIRYRWVYGSIAFLMVALPLLVVFAAQRLWSGFSLGEFKWRVLALETIGVVLFGIYWLVKTFEIWQTEADKKAAMGKLKPPLADSLPEKVKPWLEEVKRGEVDWLRPWPEMQNTSPEKKVAGP